MTGNSPMVDNYRPPQPLYGRIVETSSTASVTSPATTSSPSTTGPCMTVSGAQVGVPCVFPFTTRDVTYNTCTVAGGYTTPWCATKVDQAGKIIHGNWGDCPIDDPNCPNDITNEAPTK